MNRISGLEFSRRTLDALLAAGESMGRALECFEGSRHQDLLVKRLRQSEAIALGAIEGERLNLNSLALDYGLSDAAVRRWPYEFGRVFAKRMPDGQPPAPADLLAWLNETDLGPEGTTIPGYVLRLPTEWIEKRAERWQGLSSYSSGYPRLVKSADWAALWMQLSPLTRGNEVISVMIGDNALFPRSRMSAGGLVAIGLAHASSTWRAASFMPIADDFEDWASARQKEEIVDRARRVWFEAVSAGCQAVITTNNGLRKWIDLLDYVCVEERKPGRFRELMLKVAKAPALSAQELGRSAGITRQAAYAALQKGRRKALLREVTGGNSFQRFAALL